MDHAAAGNHCRAVSMSYQDVSENDPYYEAIRFVDHLELMDPASKESFAANSEATRGQIITALWRLMKEPVVNYAVDFNDLPSDEEMLEAIRWAAAEDIVLGYSDGSVGSENAVTRQQLATLLWRYAKEKGYDVSVGENTNILSYEDATEIAEYAMPAMQWACGAGILSDEDGKIKPTGSLTRGEAAQALKQFCEETAE